MPHCLRTLDGHLNMVMDLAIAPDANFVFATDDDETLRLWEHDWELQAQEPRATAHKNHA